LKRLITAGLIATLSLGLFTPASKADDRPPEFVQIVTGAFMTGAVRPDGSLWMWGNNRSGNFGLGNRDERTFTKQAGSSSDWAQVSFGEYHNVGIKKDGTLWGWGFNDIGQVGIGSVEPKDVLEPREIGGGRRFRSVSATYAHSAAIAEDGSLWAWGSNFAGELGDGTLENRSAPVQIGDDTDWVQVLTGSFHTVAFKKDGSMWAWGAVSAGRLGDGRDTRAYQLTPKRIGTFDFASVSVGSVHTLALKADGSLWGWGNNQYGQLGDGTKENRLVPTPIGSDRWHQVAALGDTSVGIKADGTLWMWGARRPGKSDPTLPSQVGTDRDWAGISRSGSERGDHVILVKRDGSLWGLGNNYNGQLGIGTMLPTDTPVKMLISRTLADILGTAGKASLQQVNSQLEPLKDYISLHFSDVDRAAWYAPALAKLVGMRVLGGYTDGTLQPTGTVGVDQFLKMLLSAGGAELANGSPYWASTWIDKAIASGFITPGQFDRYDRPITRAEMARVIAAVLRSETGATVPSDLKDRIADFSSISPADRQAVLDVYARGILTGYQDGTFRPGGTLSRAEAGVVILRVIDPGSRVPVK
jgi:alpha-tubulin suppressor-like RCC1 family protein